MRLPHCGIQQAFLRVLLLTVLFAIFQQSASAFTQGLAGSANQGSATSSLVVNPSEVIFRKVPVGSSLSLPVVLTNTASSQITINKDSFRGNAFSSSGLTLPLTLAASESFTFYIAFTPQATGPAYGGMLFSSPSNPNVSISLKGIGSAPGELIVTPATINFGSVADGGSAQQTGSITARGASVIVSSAGTGNSQFSLGGLTFPLTLEVGQSASFTMSFSPRNTGSISGTLSFVSNAASAETAALLGTGLQPYSVQLNWDASSSSVAGYNIYRGGKTGGPYGKIASLDPETSYTDTTVASGQTYYYVTTAVNSSGEESSYSNQVTAKIP